MMGAFTTAFNFEKMMTAIHNKDFTGNEDGIPVLNYDKVKDAEVNVGLGPLHTQFDDQGYAYTSLFVESAIAKWKLGSWEVVDKIPVTYNIGHLCAAEGDTVNPDGKYVIALNKLSHGPHLNVGPSQPESSQLININVVIDPGETKTIKFVADKPGVFPYYCANFCSALHQEMQGYLLVKGGGVLAKAK